MIDAHCHLNFHSFKTDYDEVIKRAFDAGVKAIINVGTKIDSSQNAIALAQKYDSPAGNLYAIVGVHPHHADKLEENWLEELEKLTKHPKVVAIGEIGMDFYSYKSNAIVDPKLQKEVFIKQLELSSKLKLPVQIHNRHAGKEIIEILQEYKSSLLEIPGMFHCFSGDIAFLKKVLDLGFYVGFDGNITYGALAPGETTPLKELVQYAPVDRIVTETDSPFLTPEPHRGSRNMPEYVIIVANFIARIKGLSFEQVADQTTKNSYHIFNLKYL